VKTDTPTVIDIWATTEFSVSIMVVACIALRPLASMVWRARLSRCEASSALQTDGPSSLVPFPGVGAKPNPYRAAEAQAGVWDQLGSEIRLNDLQPSEASRANEICITQRSKDGGSSIMEDGAFKDQERA